MSSGIGPGAGYHTGIAVQEDGQVVLRVQGRDCRDRRWAAFAVVIPWSVWEALNETAYNDREEVAQERIPGC